MQNAVRPSESFGLMRSERNLNDTHFPRKNGRNGKRNAPGGGGGGGNGNGKVGPVLLLLLLGTLDAAEGPAAPKIGGDSSRRRRRAVKQ